jgi:hypothetical protein
LMAQSIGGCGQADRGLSTAGRRVDDPTGG